MPQSTDNSSRLDSIASYILMITAVLSPLAFWPSPYFALEAVKTIVIAVGTLASAALFLISFLKEKTLRLPPKSMVWIGVLLSFATIISSAQSGHFMKSFFGQGFEVGTGSFLLLLLVSGWVAYVTALKRVDRVMVIYTGIGAAFVVLYLLHAFRFAFGTSFSSLGILSSLTSTLVGSWYSIGIFAGMIATITLVSILLLPLPTRLKSLSWILLLLSGFGMFVVGGNGIWQACTIVFFLLALYSWKTRPVSSVGGSMISSLFKKSVLIPLIACIISVFLVFKGNAVATPTINALNAGYSELSLPWPMTLDVAVGEIKAQPLFGIGPNRFSQAFLTYKPIEINTSDLWGVEFNSGFGFIPTFAVTEGLVGSILWILFFIFFGVLGVKSLKSISSGNGDGSSIMEAEQPYAKFAIVSSYAASTFLWLMAILYAMPHVLMYYAFVMTGLWLGTSVAYGRLRSVELHPQEGTGTHKMVPVISVLFLVAIIAWGLIYIKDTIALAYFDKGLKELTVTGNPTTADSYFSKALSLHPTDIFWQGRAEAAVSQAQAVITAASSDKNASTTQVANQASDIINTGLQYAQNAIQADSSNYYNYLSAARVAEAANSLHMNNSYEAGVDAYVSAIRLNPQNPSLYVSLARFQASNNQLDQALQTIGTSLQVKNNYLDSVFLLSQIEAAKGNLPDAITAAQFAVKLNPQNAILQFQLGLFQYTNGKYSDAATTLAEAVKLQPEYANAQYFLGLAYARLGQNNEAISQFESLAVSNPTNQEIPLIVEALKSGKSIFVGANPVEGTVPAEKRSTLPLPQKNTR